MEYPLARQGVFRTVQGEGHLAGFPTVFIRLAGCPVGCPQCDEDYGVVGRASAKDIARMVAALLTPNTHWACVTGGEPTAHEMRPLLHELHALGLHCSLATAGVNEVPRSTGGWDFVSVSPHRIDASWVQREGDQLNLVFGLNGLTPAECEPHLPAMIAGFRHRYATPMSGSPQSLAAALAWAERYDFCLGFQAHRLWGLP